MSEKLTPVSEADLNLTVQTDATAMLKNLVPVSLKPANLHWIITVLLAIGLLPACLLVHLHLRIDWANLLFVYWVSFGTQSIFVAVFLYVVGFPLRNTVLPMAQRYAKERFRILALLVFAAFMLWKFGWPVGAIFIGLTIVFLEFFDRIQGDPDRLGRTFLSFFLVGSYFFIGLLLVFSYNDVIASAKFAGLYDPFFNKLDTLLLRGKTVSDLAHFAGRYLSLRELNFFEVVYFGMFLQLGAAPIILVLTSGRRTALQYVGTILTAYYCALAIFFLWPSMGPFAICSSHDVAFPPGFDMYAIQKTTVQKAQSMLNHSTTAGFTTDYYIGFPCMHIAQPLIVAWFLRKWKRILTVLIAFDAVLTAAILLLEQHYVVDLFGGMIVAALAIALNSLNPSEDYGAAAHH